jgi:ankyrin repeat protein
MSRRVILWAVVAALLLPTLCETTRFADDDDLQVTEAAPDASADQQPRKTRKRTKPATRTKRTTKSEVPAGIHVTYKNADGDDKDLDDDLRRACGRADLQEIRRLLGIRKEITDLEGADIHPRDKYGNSLLHDVARQGRVDVARLLLEEGGHDANLQNGMADRPLHMSAASAQLPMTKLLVKHGADIDPQTSWGMTPMYWAANGGSKAHVAVARFLLSQGADVNIRTTANYSMLHEAAREGHSNMCQLLLDAGSEAKSADGLGETALHKAAAGGHADVVELLLTAGLSEHTANKAGETPIEAAHRAGHDDVVEMFMQRASAAAKLKKRKKKKTDHGDEL